GPPPSCLEAQDRDERRLWEERVRSWLAGRSQPGLGREDEMTDLEDCGMTDSVDPRNAARLAEARPLVGHQTLGAPPWSALPEAERERAVLEAMKILAAAQLAGLITTVPAGHVVRHWRAQFTVRSIDDPDNSRTYLGWIRAADPDDASALLSKLGS